MKIKKNRYKLSAKDLFLLQTFKDRFAISLLEGILLLNRDIDTIQKADKFLNPDFEKLSDPFLFFNMSKVLDRIKSAINKKDRILISADYDVDGLTSLASFIRFFKSNSIAPIYFIPNRFSQGYGMDKEIIDLIEKNNIDLLITVDSGIGEFEFIENLKSRFNNLDIIITDHHKLPEKLPQVYAIIHPELSKNQFKGYCGVGVVFKILQAYFSNDYKSLKPYIIYTALGTIADIMPMLDDNRIIVLKALDILKEERPLYIDFLLKDKKEDITVRDLSFQVIPKLNAPGRLTSGQLALDILLADKIEEIENLSIDLNNLNTKRREVEEQILKEADGLILKNRLFENDVMFLCKDNWNVGLLGIIASKLRDKYKRVCCICSKVGSEYRGSCRSPETISLLELFRPIKDYFVNFGGHKNAAGFTIKEDKFLYLVRDYFSKFKLDHISKEEDIEVETQISFKEIDYDLYRSIERFSPFGKLNPQPIFFTESVIVNDARYVGNKESKHLYMQLKDRYNNLFRAIWFNSTKSVSIDERVDIVFSIMLNDFFGLNNIELYIKDIKRRIHKNINFNIKKHLYVLKWNFSFENDVSLDRLLFTFYNSINNYKQSLNPLVVVKNIYQWKNFLNWSKTDKGTFLLYNSNEEIEEFEDVEFVDIYNMPEVDSVFLCYIPDDIIVIRHLASLLNYVNRQNINLLLNSKEKLYLFFDRYINRAYEIIKSYKNISIKKLSKLLKLNPSLVYQLVKHLYKLKLIQLKGNDIRFVEVNKAFNVKIKNEVVKLIIANLKKRGGFNYENSR